MVINVDANAVVADGLSMPHSPRWHAGKLWVLDAGVGGLGLVDPRTGAYTEVIRLPGFTRGLEVRDSVHFGHLPLTEVPACERACGVWAVDTVTGKSSGWVKFDDEVQESVAVLALPGLRHPELFNDDHDLIARTFVLPG